MSRRAGLLLLVLAAAACKGQPTEREQAEAVIRDLQRSHVDANVPTEADFDRLLRRDLTGYFTRLRNAPVEASYELLRESPTQSGIAFPKYYLWIRLGPGGQPKDRGAVRVAAIQGERFEVTDFLSEEDIRQGARIEQVFPEPVCERIRGLMGR
ncbi:MAG: hypothetical protein QM704_22190 [Anaeromyxobacteraceae bacterium]